VALENKTSEHVNIPDWDSIQAEEIQTLKFLGERIGYGRCVQIIQQAWSEKLKQQEGVSQNSADLAAGIICVWCDTDKRTGKVVRNAT
jgi:hypothetical protein